VSTVSRGFGTDFSRYFNILQSQRVQTVSTAFQQRVPIPSVVPSDLHRHCSDSPELKIEDASIFASNDVELGVSLTRPDKPMRTTLTIDDQLLAEAQRITGVTEKSALVREGLRALIERESARRLAALGGSEPQLRSVSRRQTKQ